MTNLTDDYAVFFHGAMEIADISKQIRKFPKTDYTTVELLALEILTSTDAKKKVQFASLQFNFLSIIYNFSLSLSVIIQTIAITTKMSSNSGE